MQKIEQAIALDGSTAPKEKDRIEDSPGWIARGVDYVKNGWNDLTGSPNSTTHPKIQRTMNLDIQGNSGFGGPRGGGPRGAGGHVDSGGGYRGDGGNGSAKSGGNAKESPSFFERFTGWLDHKWNSLTKRFKGGGGSNASGGKPPTSGSNKSQRNWAEMNGQLREAANGKGNFSIGSATREEADLMGKAWVGKGYKVASDGRTLVSKDGMRQYRPPTYKPRLEKFQANFEQKVPGQKTKQWQSNAHLDIID